MDQRSDDTLAKILWDYNFLKTEVKKADCILVLGSNDIRVVDRGVELYNSGMAPLLIFSGGVGELTKDLFDKAEAEVFADRAVKLGVPRSDIYIENKSTNTGENIIFTKNLIEEKGLKIKSIILVQKPYMLRRAYATFKKQWPEMEFIVTSFDINFLEYPNKIIPKEFLINILVGDTQRIRIYPEKGFQIAQDMPDVVWEAYLELVKKGYTKHLVIEKNI